MKQMKNKIIVRALVCLSTLLSVFILFPTMVDAQTATDANFKVAFIGDSAASGSFQSVLNLIKGENAQMVIHQGDMDYSDGPQTWMNMVNNTLGTTFPYLASDGNHDEWDADGYAAFFKDRLTKLGITPPSGTLSPSYTATYKGLKIVFSQEDGDPSFIDTQLKPDTHIWKICSWHKNMKLMQIGGKTDEQGWPDYETCRKYGAIIATGHEHSYERTKTLINTQTQIVDSTCSDPKNVCVAPGKTFVFVSGMGGNGIRNQDLCLPTTYPYGCKGEWASIYTADQSAKAGALFIIFNYNGVPNKAHGYFKNISGQIIDEFTITAAAQGGPTSPPISVAPGTTALSLHVLLHGLGAGGDNQNSAGGGTANPLRPSRPITVTLTDQNNVALPPKQGVITFDSATGSFKGTILLDSSVTTGSYLVKVKVDNYLTKVYPGIQAITKGSVTSLPSITLVTGDSNNDNLISIGDFTLIIDCFSDLTPARNCADPAKKQSTDLTDDGKVNQFDYNLFLRELSVQSGQ